MAATTGGCSSTPTVTDGGINCGAGSTECNGSCTAIARDPENCGACGKKCAAGEYCSAGICTSGCGMSTTKCGAECVDTKSDPRNCGACGTKCSGTQVCNMGTCATSCSTGQTQCGMSCVDAQTDRANCGACGTVCKDGEICSAGKCELSCQAGLTKCTKPLGDGGTSDASADASGDGGDAGPQLGAVYCANLQTDNQNCGACGVVCGSKKKCVDGACVNAIARTIPNFSGQLGPDYSGDGYTQCVGYLDNANTDDIPQNGWANPCKIPSSRVRIACGANANAVRYLDLGRNVFNQILTSFPETGLIVNSNFAGWSDQVYANGNDLNTGTSWIGGGAGCNEASPNLTINNACPYDAANCFGQNINGSRYLYVYVKP
jgi:hypothetical protein